MTTRQLVLFVALILAILALFAVFAVFANPLLLLCPAVILIAIDRLYPAV